MRGRRCKLLYVSTRAVMACAALLAGVGTTWAATDSSTPSSGGAGKKPASAEATAGKPNILVIWGDDIGWSNISAYNYGARESAGNTEESCEISRRRDSPGTERQLEQIATESISYWTHPAFTEEANEIKS